MSLRINVNDPDLVDTGFDVNGDQIFSYNGVPFTGIQEEYYPNNPQQLWAEMEYIDGYMMGVFRQYHPNGQLELEYTKGKGGFDGTWKKWDINGNLIVDSLYIEGEKQY